MKGHSDDQKLWQEFKKGSIQAFTQIYENHYRALYAYGHCYTNETDVIKDCIQEVFSDLWQNREKTADVTRIRAYLMVCLKREIFSQEKARFIFNPVNTREESSFENLLIDHETNTAIKSAIIHSIALLTQRQKEVVYLKFYAGLDYKDISAITSTNYQSVRNLMHEAIKSLKKNLALMKV